MDISVFVTSGPFMGKRISVSGINENTTLHEFVEKFVPSFGFSYLVGSLCSEFLGKTDMVFKNGVCNFLSPGKDKSVVWGTFAGSTHLTFVIKNYNHPVHLTVRGFDGQRGSVECDTSWSVVQLGKSLLEKGLIVPGDKINMRDDVYDPFTDIRVLSECGINETVVIMVVSGKEGDERKRRAKEDELLELQKREMEEVIRRFHKDIERDGKIFFDQILMHQGLNFEPHNFEQKFKQSVGRDPYPIETEYFSAILEKKKIERILEEKMEERKTCSGIAPSPRTDMRMVDVSSSEMVKLKVIPTAPDWRIYTKGLTMEGTCKKAGCVAHNKQVLCRHGYVTFTLGTDESRCPMCKTVFEPIRPLFFECVVVYNGMKADKTRIAIPPRTFSATAPETYRIQEKEGDGGAKVIEYKYLIIVISKLETLALDPQTDSDAVIPRHCHKCHDPLNRENAQFPGLCGHVFHKACVENWKKVSNNCPVCSLPFAGV